jgi:hypothetical protein
MKKGCDKKNSDQKLSWYYKEEAVWEHMNVVSTEKRSAQEE